MYSSDNRGTSVAPFPNWRYREADRLATVGRPVAGAADRYVRLILRFIRNRRSAKTIAEVCRLEQKMPATAAAHELWRNGGDLRHVVEARILAGDIPTHIADQSGVPLSAIQIYEHVFFDVRSNRRRADFVLNIAVFSASGTESHADRFWRTIKILGWLGGVFVLDEILNPSHMRGPVESPEHVAADLSERSREILRANAAIAVSYSDLEPASAEQIVRLATQREFERQPDQLDIASRRYTENVVAFLENYKLSVGRRTIPPAMKKYCNGPVEPRAEEWNKIARGEPVPDLDDRIARGSVRQPLESENDRKVEQDSATDR